MASNLRRNVRIAAWGGVAAIALALVWAVAPALSLGPYVPEPVNFSQELPRLERLSGREAMRSEEGRVRYLSPPIEAPKRFDLVGFVDQDTPIEVRTRADDAEWSPWVETTDGEPIWTGGADELQLRSRDRRPRGEIGYVNVSGDATAGDRALNGLRGAVNAGFVNAAAILVPEEAAGEAPFEIVHRSEWDPEHSCVPRKPVYGKVKAAIVHHTVNSNTYTPEEAPGVVLAICRYHRYSHGWNDIGYNALVDRFGTIYTGRAGGLTKAVIGAHTAGYNSQSFGVSSIGTHTTSGMSSAAIEGITDLLAWKLSLHGIDAQGRTKLESAGGAGNKYPAGTKVSTREIGRHRRFNATSCPGRAQISKIIEITQEKIASGQSTAPPEPPPEDGGVPVLP
jgi:N-acetylmuramoyl-L-alanine amidase